MQLLHDYLTTWSAVWLSRREQEDETFGPLIRHLKQLFTALCGKSSFTYKRTCFLSFVITDISNTMVRTNVPKCKPYDPTRPECILR